MNANGCLQISHVVFVSWSHDLIMLVSICTEALVSIDIHSMQTKNSNALGPFRISSCHQPPLGCGEILSNVKAKARKITDSADGAVIVLSLDAVRCVFNYSEVMPTRNIHDLIHCTRPAREMYRNNSFGSGRDGCLDCGRLNEHRFTIYV